MLSQVPDLDYLTLEYLAELSLSIMAIQRERNAEMGYARCFIEQLDTFAKHWEQGKKFKVITNAGGLNPKACARECIDFFERKVSRPIKVGIVMGDDVLQQMKGSHHLKNLDTGRPFDEIRERLVSANAYIGAKGIVEALNDGADLVITGRVTDASLTLAPCVAHFGWNFNDYERLAKGTVAGHLLECGAQVTGGIATDWLSVPHPEDIAFPFVEMEESGDFVITKPPKTGGRVDEMSVKEQLLYEVGHPFRYLSPDVTVSFEHIEVKQEGADRVRVLGPKGTEPTDCYKVSATYRDGFKAEGSLIIFGGLAQEKARVAGKALLDSLKKDGITFEESLVECLGMGDAVPGVIDQKCEGIECVLRVAVKDSDKEKVAKFTKELASLVTRGPPGTTGYTTGKPEVRAVFGFWPCLIPKEEVRVETDVYEVMP